jgi:hypothetical protein
METYNTFDCNLYSTGQHCRRLTLSIGYIYRLKLNFRQCIFATKYHVNPLVHVQGILHIYCLFIVLRPAEEYFT